MTFTICTNRRGEKRGKIDTNYYDFDNHRFRKRTLNIRLKISKNI